MSDATEAQGAVAAPEATPDATEAPQQQTTTVNEPTGPDTRRPDEMKRDARQRVRDAVTQRISEGQKAQKAAEQPRDDQGKFTKAASEDTDEPDAPDASADHAGADEAESSDTEAPGDIASADAPDAGASTEPPDDDAETSPDGMERVAIPEGHPLRDRGKDHIPVPQEFADEVRYILNHDTRKQEIKQTQESLRAERMARLKAEAEAEFWQQHGQEILGPDFHAQYQDILETYGEESAEAFKQGRMAKAQSKINEQVSERVRQDESQELMQRGVMFRNIAFADATGQPVQLPNGQMYQPQEARFPGWSWDGPNGIQQALVAYGATLRAQGVDQPTARDWYNIAETFYQRTDAGQRRRAEQERARREQESKVAKSEAEAEAKRREEERLRDAAQRHQTNPHGRVRGIETGARTPIGDEKGDEWKGLSPGQRRRAIKEKMREYFTPSP